jgi:hypothetical protein
MNSRIVTATPVSDAVKDMLRAQIKSGWTSERIAYSMQQLGHEGWNASTANTLTRPGVRPLTVDEAIGLIAVFRSRSQLMAREADRLTALLNGREEKGQ